MSTRQRRLLAWPAVAPAILAICAAVAAARGATADDRLVRVATLNWPPYTSASLPNGGAVTSVVRAAFAQRGYDVEVRFWPWKRAIAKAWSGQSGIVGYFPGYHCRHDTKTSFLTSDPMGRSPLGLAERVKAPHSWSDLQDLAKFRIGTVVGYANTAAFDARVAAGRQRVIKSSDDRTNLRKLLQGRLDYAVVDKFVLAYMRQTDPALARARGRIVLDERLLGLKQLFLCFRADPKGRRLRRVFNSGLERLDAQGMLRRYVERIVRG